MITSKKELRKNFLSKRNEMAEFGKIRFISNLIVERIKRSLDFINSKNIAIYIPIKNEVDLTPLLKEKNKNFYLPRCNENALEFCEFDSISSLKKGSFNIPEPEGKAINPSILDVIYIPALAANHKCYRLGYGRGYYDRFFSENTIKAKKIIVLSSEFVSDKFIEDDFDVKCDKIICEKYIN